MLQILYGQGIYQDVKIAPGDSCWKQMRHGRGESRIARSRQAISRSVGATFFRDIRKRKYQRQR